MTYPQLASEEALHHTPEPNTTQDDRPSGSVETDEKDEAHRTEVVSDLELTA